jgi:hypothetical protein
MEKQWEESISAMSKRDQSLQAVQDSKDKIQTHYHEMNIHFRELKSQRDEAEARQKEAESGKSWVAFESNRVPKLFENDCSLQGKTVAFRKRIIVFEKRTIPISYGSIVVATRDGTIKKELRSKSSFF